MKKVLFIATVVKTHINVFHIPFLKMFHDAGWEVHVAAKNDFPEGEKCFIPYCDVYYDIPFDRSPFKKSNLRAYWMLKNIMRENQYDIVHCHTPVGGVLARLAGRNCKYTRMIYTAHGFHFYKGAPLINWLVYYPVELICAHYTDTLITINQEDYQRACKFRLRNYGDVEYVPGVGIDLEKYKPNKIDRALEREKLGIDKKTKLILNVGELSKRKNQQALIHALHMISNDHFVCYICGEGKLHQSLQHLINEMGMNQKIKLLGFRNDIEQILQAADLFVFPSLQEGLPVALMQAMAAGTSIICSNIRGNVDLIHNGENGYIVNCHDIKDLAKKIFYLLNNKDKCQYFYKNNLQRINLYKINNICKMMKIIYKI